MKKAAKVLMGIQIGVLMTTVALPVQAALIIGAPRQLSGSVITLKSSAPLTTPAPVPVPVPAPPPAPAPALTVSSPTHVNIGPLPSNQGGNVISLKNYQQITPVPVTLNPTPAPAPVPPANQTGNSIPPVSALTADEQLMVDMINQERIAAGLNPVIADLRLTAVGRAKANDMKVNNYFSHTSPTYGSPWAMMQQAGITVRWAGENISGNKSVPGSMAALMQSPGHKANILDPRFTHVGVGIAYGSAYGNLYVQEFLQQ
ncbi:CAP domain-containing protein [Desulfosporosinus nitroreducens]|uniref:CAP domain-containing protein n=1 Tax=Desulfosporosinus nitroreducens TaxID=2018668 RepID=A0ABT8QVF9_9FIRM|nr:CAP domain-containing protein [Desulfosporosinus nitroreducens]MDO0825341.1 CAP domain-containing protein [Desulfosporosinus nitroreducens]